MEKNSNTFKKILKIVSVIALVLVVCVTILVVYILKSLPSAKEIGQVLKSQPKTSAPVSQTASLQTGAVVSASEVVAVESVPVSGVQLVEQSEEQKKQTDKKALDDLMDNSKPLSQFCGILQNAKPVSPNDNFTNDALIAKDPTQADPKYEPLKTLFRSVFRLPAMNGLVSAVTESEKNGQLKDDLFSKAQFYGQALFAFNQMMDYRPEFNNLGDKTYLQMMLNAAVASKKEAYQDQRLQKYCEDIEHSINSGESFSFEQEKKNLERLLDELQINHQAIGYNPNYKSNFDISFNKQSLTFAGGWLQDLFKPQRP